MSAGLTEHANDRLILAGRLSELSRLQPWIEDVATHHAIDVNLQFAINVCLEEVLSNIILHGYRGQVDRSITIVLTEPRPGYFIVTVEDEAPPYNPLEASELPPLGPQDEFRVGGQGIRFLRQFSRSLEYEPIPAGNRLKVGFGAEASK